MSDNKTDYVSFPSEKIKCSYFVEDPKTHERCRVYVVKL